MKRSRAAIVACAAVLCGCTAAGESFMTEIRGDVWSEPVEVAVPNSDTLGVCDMNIALRHDGRATGRRVAMTVKTVTPDSLWVEEPLTMTPGDDGRSRSAQHEASCAYRLGVRFARTGTYRIIITPTRPVQGVTAVGVDVARRPQNQK